MQSFTGFLWVIFGVIAVMALVFGYFYYRLQRWIADGQEEGE